MMRKLRITKKFKNKVPSLEQREIRINFNKTQRLPSTWRTRWSVFLEGNLFKKIPSPQRLIIRRRATCLKVEFLRSTSTLNLRLLAKQLRKSRRIKFVEWRGIGYGPMKLTHFEAAARRPKVFQHQRDSKRGGYSYKKIKASYWNHFKNHPWLPLIAMSDLLKDSPIPRWKSRARTWRFLRYPRQPTNLSICHRLNSGIKKIRESLRIQVSKHMMFMEYKKGLLTLTVVSSPNQLFPKNFSRRGSKEASRIVQELRIRCLSPGSIPWHSINSKRKLVKVEDSRHWNSWSLTS